MNLNRQIVERTLVVMREVVERMRIQVDAITTEYEQTVTACQFWENELLRIDAAPRKSRALKGENLTLVLKAYRSNGADAGYTTSELKMMTGLSWSSVRNVLTKRSADRFIRKRDKYFLKAEGEG